MRAISARERRAREELRSAAAVYSRMAAGMECGYDGEERDAEEVEGDWDEKEKEEEEKEKDGKEEEKKEVR
jgi:hypothetical protein